MDCKLVQAELIGYHFKTVSDEIEQEIGDHFVGCPSCLRSYLDLRKHAQLDVTRQTGPTVACRQQLRAEVCRTFRPSLISRIHRYVRTPIPLYQSAAALVLVVLMVGVANRVSHRAAGDPSASGSGGAAESSGIQVDSSDDAAGSANIS